jgi:hypothetical protein
MADALTRRADNDLHSPITPLKVLQRRVDAAKVELLDELTLQSHGDVAVVKAAFAVIELDAEAAGLDEATATATEEAVRLEVLAASRETVQQQLKGKYEQINRFKDTTAAKHAVIKELLRAQSAAAPGLISAANSVQHVMRTTVTPAAAGAVSDLPPPPRALHATGRPSDAAVRRAPCSVLRAPCSVLRAPCSVLRACSLFAWS